MLCPSWGFFRYFLGLAPEFDKGPRHFRLSLHCGTTLAGASGSVPTRDGSPVAVSWRRGAGRAATDESCSDESRTVVFTLDPGDASVVVSGWPGQPGWHTITAPTTVTLPDCV